jgi:ribosomal protein S18 acetylase RimI-like enzyme
MVWIDTVTQVSDEIGEAFQRLFPQLSPAVPPERAQLEEIVASPACTILLARDDQQDGKIVGTLTLVMYRVPNGKHAWIEDVVVDERSRRQGIGEMLTWSAIERAKAAGAKSVDLTSRPVRQDANRLYQRMGFVLRNSNLYRFEL